MIGKKKSEKKKDFFVFHGKTYSINKFISSIKYSYHLLNDEYQTHMFGLIVGH